MVPSSTAAYQSLQGFKRRSAQDTVSEAENKYNVGGLKDRVSSLRGLVGNLESSVEAVDPSVTGRTTGTFTTEGQRQALVSRERAPILTDLGKQQRALGEGVSEYSGAQGLAGNLANILLSENQTEYQGKLDQYNAALASEQAAEQKRQFEEQLKLQREQQAAAERASNAANRSLAGYFGDGSKDSSASDPASEVKNTAKAEVQQSLVDNASDYGAISREINAIMKSASYGNTKDKYKLEWYKALMPGLFKDGNVNMGRLDALSGMNRSIGGRGSAAFEAFSRSQR